MPAASLIRLAQIKPFGFDAQHHVREPVIGFSKHLDPSEGLTWSFIIHIDTTNQHDPSHVQKLLIRGARQVLADRCRSLPTFVATPPGGLRRLKSVSVRTNPARVSHSTMADAQEPFPDVVSVDWLAERCVGP